MKEPAPNVSGVVVNIELKKLHNMKQDIVQYAIELCNGNKGRAAKILGISRKSVYNILRKVEGSHA